MPDVRSLSQQSLYNGRLINQLTASSILKDTDLFAISSDNLTRCVSLSQIKSAVTSNYYNKDDINQLLDVIREQVKSFADETFGTGVDVAEFRNEFNEKLQTLRNDLTIIINDKEGKLKDKDNELLQMINGHKERINQLFNKVDIINENITEIQDRITYGTAIPTTLETGKIYLQYF